MTTHKTIVTGRSPKAACTHCKGRGYVVVDGEKKACFCRRKALNTK